MSRAGCAVIGLGRLGTPIAGGPRLVARTDVAVLAIATGLAALVVLLGVAGAPVGLARVVAGLFLVAYAPGGALLALVRPRLIASSARVVLAVPLSLASSAIAGVVLDRTPIGITPSSMAIALLAITVVLLAAGLLLGGRDPGRPPAEIAPPPPPSIQAQNRADAPDTPAPTSDTAVGRAEGDSGWIARLRRVPGERRIAGLVHHLRDPLFLNAYALGLSGVVTSGLGVVYWAVAARLYPPDVVGVNASLVSLVTLLANVSQLNLRSGFGRFVPIAGRRTRALIHGGYLAAFVIALVTGAGTMFLLAADPRLLAAVPMTPVLAWLFPLTVVLWTVFTVQDHVLVAFRRSSIVPIENGVFALAKIVLLVPLATIATDIGILVSWVVPAAIGFVIVTGWILGRLVPRQQAAAEAAIASGRAPLRPDGRPQGVTPGEIVRYVSADYLGSLLSIGSASILPVLVLAVLGAASSAHFYMVITMAMATQLVPTVLATSLLVEVASGRAEFDTDGARVTRQLVLLLGPILLVLVVFAEPILGVFGSSYAQEGATALRLFALAGIPYALVNLAFIRLRLEGRVRWIVLAQAVLAVLLLVPSAVVLPAWGITGLGAVTVVSQSLVAVVLTWTELRPLLRGVLPSRGHAAPWPEPTKERPEEPTPDDAAAPVAQAAADPAADPEPVLEPLVEPAPAAAMEPAMEPVPLPSEPRLDRR